MRGTTGDVTGANCALRGAEMESVDPVAGMDGGVSVEDCIVVVVTTSIAVVDVPSAAAGYAAFKHRLASFLRCSSIARISRGVGGGNSLGALRGRSVTEGGVIGNKGT